MHNLVTPLRSITLLGCFAFQAVALAQNPPAAPPRDPVLVTISKETTRITEPLKPSGYPDFLEAMNLAAKGQVTPATNGAILLVRATGPRGVSEGSQEDEFYRRLGIPPLPDLPPDHRRHTFHADFIQSLQDSELPPPTAEELKIKDDYERGEAARLRVSADFEHCSEQPWKANEHPIVARWLKEQQPSFAQLDKLRDYPDAYQPWLVGTVDGSLRLAEVPLRRIGENMTLDLNLRAFYQLGLGQYDEALDDLERILILSRYNEKTCAPISLYSAASIREICYPLVNQLSLNSPLTTKQLGRLKELVQNYNPPLETQLARMSDQPARWVTVEAVCRFAEYGPGGSEAKPIPRPAREDLDYDQMLNYMNPFYDRLAEALGNKDLQQRGDLCVKLEEELTAIRKESNSKPRLVMLKLNKTGRSLLAAEKMLENLSIDLTLARAIDKKERTRRTLWQIAIALQEFHHKQGKFPPQLAQLVPDYLAALPLDPYTGEQLKYQSDGKGVLAYSLGFHGDDNQGYDGKDADGQFCDDIAIYTNDRRPKPPQPKPARDFFE